MRAVAVTSDFEGYPDGVNARIFRKGEKPDLPDDYADLLVRKGLADDIAPTVSSAPEADVPAAAPTDHEPDHPHEEDIAP